MPTRSVAFTLIELLIVVAIIAILAAIAVPNFLEAQTRAKVSRAKADMRTTVLAIELYAVDENRYPLPDDREGLAMNGIQATHVITNTTPWFETSVPQSLTTPIAYLSSRLNEPFPSRIQGDNPQFKYTSISYLKIRAEFFAAYNHQSIYRQYFRDLKGQNPSSEIGYFLVSHGPDKDHDIDAPHGPTAIPHVHGEGAVYDPTNGTVSSGDIHYFGPGIGFLN